MPDTFAYYVAAYVAAGLLYGGYVASLVVRSKRLSPRTENRIPRTDG